MKKPASASVASQPESPSGIPKSRTWAAHLRRCCGHLLFTGLGGTPQLLAAPSCSHPKPLLIKSPVHTARIGLLLDMFPRARFVYIHRHPLQVWG